MLRDHLFLYLQAASALESWVGLGPNLVLMAVSYVAFVGFWRVQSQLTSSLPWILIHIQEESYIAQDPRDQKVTPAVFFPSTRLCASSLLGSPGSG